MFALSVTPQVPNSARLTELPTPARSPELVLVKTLAIGVCGTDREILAGDYGSAPSGRAQLIIGHESLGEVVEAPHDCGLRTGDRVVPIVRLPDPVPCIACASGESDMCRNGLYTEHGIKGQDGFCVEQFMIDPRFVVPVDSQLATAGVLIEPASVVAKAWDHIERIGARTRSWKADTVLVTGAGPIGLLATLMAAQRNCAIHVYDRQRGGLKRELVERLGGTYHCESLDQVLALLPDVVIECTGSADVIAATMSHNARAGIVCLAGLSSGAHHLSYDFAALNRSLVLENDVIFGSVNANRRHYELAAAALSAADPNWLREMITRRVALRDWEQAFVRQPADIKVIIDFCL